MAQRLLLQAQTALGSYAEPGWASDERLAGVRRPAAGSGARVEPGFGPSAGVRQRAVHIGAVAATTSPCWPTLLDNEPASGELAGSGDRHRSALAHRHRAGRRRRHRRRRPGDAVHRRRGRDATRPPRAGATARGRGGARPQAAVKEQAWQQVDRGRHAGQHHRARRSSAASSQPGQGELLAPFTRALLRRDPRRLGAPLQRGRADGGDRAVPVVGHQPGRRRRRRRSSSPTPSCRRRCAGWCSRAAPASSGRCGRGRSTLAGRPDGPSRG